MFLPKGEKDSTFIFLSNTEDITFEQAWKAAGFSSNIDDYFDVEVTKFVWGGGASTVDHSEGIYIYEGTSSDSAEAEPEETVYIPAED